MSRYSIRPRLAYVVLSLNPGGTERLVVDMSRTFNDEFEIDIVCLDEPGAWAEDLRRDGIAVYSLWRQPGLDLSVASKLARQLRARQTDIIHAHQCTPWFYAALSRLAYRRPRLLFEEHGRFYPEIDNRKRRVVNRLVTSRLTDRVVAVSNDIRERLARFEGLHVRQIEVVYNGVQPIAALSCHARAERRRALGFDEQDFVIGTVGRFDKIKNLPMLVHSLAQVRKRVPNARGLLVGDGPEASDIRKLIEGIGMADLICLPGFRNDARELIQCMDLFVLASLSEGTSIALLDAMTAGVPVAVTAVGGNVEVVEAGVSGWVVPSNSVDSLSSAMLEAATDPQKRAQNASNARKRFMENFTFDGMIGRYQQIYSELLTGHTLKRGCEDGEAVTRS